MPRRRSTAFESALRVVITCAASACALVSTLDAQSVLPAAPSDSIVRLAVDPAQNRGRPFVLLLDEGYNRLEADGRSVRRIRQVYQVLDQSVVRALSERAFSYEKSRQALTVDWIRVLKPSGEVLSDKPA